MQVGHLKVHLKAQPHSTRTLQDAAFGFSFFNQVDWLSHQQMIIMPLQRLANV